MAKRGLTIGEIVLGVAAGAVAAGAAALILDDSNDTRPQIVVAAAPQNYDLAPFAEISTTGPQDVVITYGEVQLVRAEGPAEALAQLEAVVVDDRLLIRPKGFGGSRGRDGNFQFPGMPDWEGLAGVTFHVTVPRLEGVALAGSGDVTIDRIEGARFEGRVAGPGELSIENLEVDEADLSIGGSGTLSAAGVATKTRVSIGGSGEVDAGGLTSDTASISIGGSGDVELTVQQEALISIAGSGNVDIDGPATCSVSRMGSGAVSCNGDSQ